MTINAAMATILIADDHQLFNDGLKNLLSAADSPFRVVGQVFSGHEVIPAVVQHQPDILLLDINLPHRNGLDLAKELQQGFPAVKIIVLTMYSYLKFVNDFQLLGVAGYLLKNVRQDELLTCIRQVVAGERYFDAQLTSRVPDPHADDIFIKKFSLTPRELEVIRLMRDGLTSPEIAARIFLSEETVKTHRKNIYFKLGINSLAELIRFANEQGL